MDKYTVDLDKVLNDFEYSEYSLESAKVNRSNQNEIPNTSFNTHHCNRVDTTVKHSINNVFHSLNEYLSSDITPKKIENIHTSIREVDVSSNSQASSFLIKPQTIDVTPQISANLSCKNESHAVIEHNYAPINYGDNYVVNSDQNESNVDKSDVNTANIGLPITNTFDNKIAPQEMPENKNSLYCSSLVSDENLPEIISNLSNGQCKEIIVDLSNENTCGTTDEVHSEIPLDKNKTDNKDALIDIKELVLQKMETSLEMEDLLKSKECPQDEKSKARNNSILNQKSIVLDEKIVKDEGKPELTSKFDESIIESKKIGFDHDVEIDEGNIEQYFQELEEELGIQVHEKKNKNEETPILKDNIEIVEIKHVSEESKDCDLTQELSIEANREDERNAKPSTVIVRSVCTKGNEHFLSQDQEYSSEKQLEGNISKEIHENTFEKDDEPYLDLIEQVEISKIESIKENSYNSLTEENIQAVAATSHKNLNDTEGQNIKPQESEENSRPQSSSSNSQVNFESKETSRPQIPPQEKPSTSPKNLNDTKIQPEEHGRKLRPQMPLLNGETPLNQQEISEKSKNQIEEHQESGENSRPHSAPQETPTASHSNLNEIERQLEEHQESGENSRPQMPLPNEQTLLNSRSQMPPPNETLSYSRPQMPPPNEETLSNSRPQISLPNEETPSNSQAKNISVECQESGNKIRPQMPLPTEESHETPSNSPAKNQPLEYQESGKNSRPQILPLNEETQETTRKIDLIGEPGSTPYNNLYSTKDFSKIITGCSGDNTARAVSPTYSDVSTDSVSSSSSEETTENDGESERQHKTVANEDSGSTKMVQNNLLHPVETARSDVTMDKDFKNNLKPSNARTEDGPSTSGAHLDDGVGVQDDEQDQEGACAMVVERSSDYSNENIAREEEQNKTGTAGSTTGIDWLGKQAPLWIPDSEAMSCLHCDMKFTVIKRRHHCRACGLVLCSKCCNLRYRLEYLNAEARVCMKCFEILNKDTNSNSGSEISQESSSPSRNLNATQESLGQPNPNNPLEYCSTIPPTQQVDTGAAAVPSVMVPVGVLKRKGSNKGRSNKSVMFCDGIRPGSDLTNLDTDFNYSENQKLEKQKKSSEKSTKTGRNLDMIDSDTKSFIPSDEKSLPPTVTIFKTDMKYSPCSNNTGLVETLKNETLTFALQSNVFVHVKIINMDCCISRVAWCFSTEGLINVGQDEIVVLLEYVENESVVPKEIFVHLNYVYLEAVKGSSVKELGMSLHPSSPFLGSKNHFGFIYIRPTFQCLQNVILPKEPYLIGILIHRWETPWAKLFPLRLVLRLGAEYKYYPSPIISTRDRDSVFVEIGHTIINLLADFRNFSYSLPQIRGLTIHMEDKNTTVTIPKNRYDQVLKSLSNSSDHILAFAGNFSSLADSHLVCIQDTQSAANSYTTHAINICNQPRKVTGASFIVFNGALKSTSGLTAKSNIVEDGLMIQILPEHMVQVRDSLKNMRNHTIKCGCINEESDETVTIVWGEQDTSFNVGVLSPIDNKDLTGIPSIRVHNGKDYTCNSGTRLIRWTEVFISQCGDEAPKNQESIDISKISENISKATCQALVKYLDLLVSNSFYKIGLRTHIHVENVSYSAGSNNVKLPPIYMKSLDNELIPVLHRIASNNVTEQPIVLELIFRILNV